MIEHFDEKMAITPKWVMGITSKLQGMKILTGSIFLQFKLNFYLLQFLKYNTKSIKIKKKLMKKGNNSKMGNQNYFKIAEQVDPDMLNMFAVSTCHLSLIVFEIKDEKY